MEKHQDELKEMMLALERDKDLEASEKQRLEEEILAKAEEIQQMQTDVDEKEQETLRLQEEINEANLQMQVPDLDVIKATRICHALNMLQKNVAM